MNPALFTGRGLVCCFIILSCTFKWASAQEPAAQEPNAPALYKQQCALCHEKSSETRAPSPAAMRLMSPENVLRALETGRMKDQGALLTAAQRKMIAEFLTGKPLGQTVQSPVGNSCADTKTPLTPSSNDWNGWSPDPTNARFQPTASAGLTGDQVLRLKLKWAFAFPNAPLAWGQPTIFGGRIFVPSVNRNVYSLDAKSGCQYWSFETEAPARTAMVIAALPGEPKRYVAFLGDSRATAYAVDAATGELLWKARVDAHPRAKIVGALEYFDSKVFVPLTGGEEVGLGDKYECCSSRGALVALDAATGKQIWKTYTIAEEPHATTKTAAGIQNRGPSGASIWSAPTIDAKRRIIYAGTGDNFSEPSTETSDAVLAFAMDSGKLLWSKQLTKDDVLTSFAPGKVAEAIWGRMSI